LILNFIDLFEVSLSDQLPTLFILGTTVVALFSRFFSFIKASNVEKHLENKTSKMFRKFYTSTLLFIFLFLVSLILQVGIFKYYIHFFIFTFVIFIICMLILRYKKPNFYIKLFRKKIIIKVKKVRPYLLSLNGITVLILYLVVASAMATSFKVNM
jgi:hypothetical protein